jgi:hypothetical protein
MRDGAQPSRAIVALAVGSAEADSMRTRCNVRVAALSWEEGQRHAARILCSGSGSHRHSRRC